MDELDKKIQSLIRKGRNTGMTSDRKACPADSILSSYLDGALGAKEKENIEGHLADCPNCLDLVVMYSRVRAAEAQERIPEVPESLVKNAMDLVSAKEKTERIFDIVLQFARDTIEIITNPANLGIMPMAAPVPVRGEATAEKRQSIKVNKAFENVVCEVEILRSADETLSIRALLKGTQSGEPVDGMRVSLLNPDREVASTIAREGIVQFAGLHFGSYILKLSSRGEAVGQVSLDIQG